MTQTDDYAMAAYAGSANERKRGRICYLLGKTDNRKARSISFSHIRNKRVQKVNLQWRYVCNGFCLHSNAKELLRSTFFVEVCRVLSTS